MIWVGRPRRQLGALRMMLALILIAGGLQGGLIGVPTVVLRGEILVVATPGPRRISVGGELLDFVVRRRVTARRRLVRFTAHCIARWRSTRLTAHRHSLADKPRQFGQRIVSLAAAQAFGVLPGRQISMPTVIAISHELRPVAGGSPRSKRPKTANLRCLQRQRIEQLSHFVWRLDPEQRKPRCEHGRNPMNKHKPSLGQLSIILDNEA